MNLNSVLMQSSWFVQICTQISFFILKFVYEFFLFFSQIHATHVNFVHEIRTKFIIFGKLGKSSYEFARIHAGYVMNGLYC